MKKSTKVLINYTIFIIIHTLFIIRFTPTEVYSMNGYFVFKAYDAYSFTVPIEEQLEAHNYNKETIVALHNLRSYVYNFDDAREYILGDGPYDGLYNYGLEPSVVTEELDRIHLEVSRKATFLGYLINNLKLLLFLTIFEASRRRYNNKHKFSERYDVVYMDNEFHKPF